MAKKQKRQIRKSPVEAAVASPALRSGSELAPDYSHVLRDLKRIGILAGSIFATLILLSFFLK